MAPGKGLGKLVVLDATRALAALSVLFTHGSLLAIARLDAGPLRTSLEGAVAVFGATAWASRGLHPGVVVFVVLSGLCIHGAFRPPPGQAVAGLAWRRYFRRRFLRIAPVYAVAALLGAGLGAASGAVQVSPAGLLAKLAFLGPFLPGVDAAQGNAPLGTAAVELWLYLLYPLGLWLRERGGGLALVAGLLALQGVAALELWRGVDPTFVGAGLPVLASYWWLGALAAEAADAPVARRGAALGAVALALYLAAGNLLHWRGLHLGLSLLLAIAAAALLAWAVAREREAAEAQAAATALAPAASAPTAAPRGFARFAQLVADRSYSLYAVHFPVLAAVALALPAGSAWVAVAPTAAALAAAWLLYLAVERPSHQLALRGPRPRT